VRIHFDKGGPRPSAKRQITPDGFRGWQLDQNARLLQLPKEWTSHVLSTADQQSNSQPNLKGRRIETVLLSDNQCKRMPLLIRSRAALFGESRPGDCIEMLRPKIPC